MKIDKALRERMERLGDESRHERLFHVYVSHEGSLEDLELGGIVLHPSLGGPARGTLSASEIEALAEIQGILRIELPVRQELHLNETVPHIRANLAWALQTPQLRGNGVIVAVIDSGIDVLHESFQDGSGNTRILALWDQTFRYNAAGNAVNDDNEELEGDQIPRDEQGNVITEASDRSPAAHPTLPGNAVNPDLAAFDFGAEFTRDQINTALDRHRNQGQDIPISLRDDPESSNHGTHVAGIAAGDGSMPGNCSGADTFVGVAPAADLIIVKVGFTNNRVQDTQAAMEYAIVKARSNPGGALPIALNLSLGTDIGQHNGFSATSIFMRNLLSGSQGEAIIRSAGNSRNDAIHAAVTVAAGDDTSIDFSVSGGKSRVTFWMSYPAGGDFSYELQLPGAVSRDTTRTINHDDDASFDEHDHTFNPTDELSRDTDPDKHASLVITSDEDDTNVTSGTWTLTVHNDSAASDLHLHIWASNAQFIKPDGVTGSAQNSSQPENWLKGTIGVDASADDVIAVGAFSIGGSDIQIAPFSSQGPAPLNLSSGLYPGTSPAKPDISAPGVGITSAKAEAFDCFLCCECCVNNYMDMQGTSQASPHVAGVVALMLQADPTLTHTQIKDMLQDTSGDFPDLDDGWPPAEELFGAGPVDARDVVQEVLDNLGTARVGAPEVARASRLARHPVIQRLTAILREWESRFGARPAWHFFVSLVGTHFVEVQRLINTERKVGAVWQRFGGPQLVRSVVMSERDIDPPIPLAVGEKRMDMLVDRLIPVLRRFAGARLLSDIERYEALARCLPGRRFDQIDDLVSGLES